MQVADANKLLDAARKKTGSDAATAAAIHQPRQRVNGWRKGRQPIPAADVVLLAELAGLDPLEWTAKAIAEPYAGTPKGVALELVFRNLIQSTARIMKSVYQGAGTTQRFTFLPARRLEDRDATARTPGRSITRAGVDGQWDGRDERH